MRGAEPAGVAVEHRVVVVEVKVSHHVVAGKQWLSQRRGDPVEALERDVPGRVVAVDADVWWYTATVLVSCREESECRDTEALPVPNCPSSLATVPFARVPSS